MTSYLQEMFETKAGRFRRTQKSIVGSDSKVRGLHDCAGIDIEKLRVSAARVPTGRVSDARYSASEHAYAYIQSITNSVFIS